jgi:hypothetical protein
MPYDNISMRKIAFLIDPDFPGNRRLMTQ